MEYVHLFSRLYLHYKWVRPANERLQQYSSLISTLGHKYAIVISRNCRYNNFQIRRSESESIGNSAICSVMWHVRRHTSNAGAMLGNVRQAKVYPGWRFSRRHRSWVQFGVTQDDNYPLSISVPLGLTARLRPVVILLPRSPCPWTYILWKYKSMPCLLSGGERKVTV